ncbi:MAG: AzlD domain-containing protein [Trueperaceae bacterium]
MSEALPGTGTIWLILVAMGAVTLIARASFLLLQDRWTMPTLFRRALTYVPPAVLAALIAPALLAGEGPGLGPLDARLLAGLVATVVAWRTRSVPATLATGMVVLWIATAATGAVASS